MKRTILALALCLSACGSSWDAPKECSFCEAWNRPMTPFRIHGQTYYVGTEGLSAVLITSKSGHVLIDGGLPQSAPQIAHNIERLGYRLEDVKLIVNSHAHFDHAGGIAALARHTHATVAASIVGAQALAHGTVPSDDPQFGFGPQANGFPPVRAVTIAQDGETLQAGGIAITAVATPGHTPGGTSWTWESCEAQDCLTIVYADSLNAVSAPGYRFSDHPETVTALRGSIARIAGLDCDILLAPHPGFVGLREKLTRRQAHPETNPFIDPTACRAYAAHAGVRLDKRLKDENSR